MSTEIEVWSDVNLYSRWIQLLLCSIKFGCRNTRFKTEFESWKLLEYLVGKNSVGLDSSTWKGSAISKRVIWVVKVPKTIPNIKVTSHDKDIVNIDFSILEISQSQLKQIRIYVNKKVNGIAIEKRNT